jgi:ribosomal protein S27E
MHTDCSNTQRIYAHRLLKHTTYLCTQIAQTHNVFMHTDCLNTQHICTHRLLKHNIFMHTDCLNTQRIYSHGLLKHITSVFMYTDYGKRIVQIILSTSHILQQSCMLTLRNYSSPSHVLLVFNSPGKSTVWMK